MPKHYDLKKTFNENTEWRNKLGLHFMFLTFGHCNWPLHRYKFYMFFSPKI